MSHRKRIRGKTRKRVLIIHSGGRTWRTLAEGWKKTAWDVFAAEGRSDGMPLMFQIRPDLIFLEVTEEQDDWRSALCGIRLFTDTPVVVVASQATDSGDHPFEDSNSMLIRQPISVRRTISKAKAFWKACR